MSRPGDDLLFGIGATKEGQAFALWYGGDRTALTLSRVADSGTTTAQSWQLSGSLVGGHLIVGADDRLYLSEFSSAGLLLGSNPGNTVSAVVVRLNADGSFGSVLDTCTQSDNGCSAYLLAASADGDTILQLLDWSGGGGTDIDLVRADGTILALFSTKNPSTPLYDSGCWAAAFDPQGNIVCGGATANGKFVPLGQSGRAADGAVAQPVVVKLDPSGSVIWKQRLPVTGSVAGIGASALGTVVASGFFRGSGQFGADRLDHGVAGTGDYAGFLVTYEQGGQERWARQLELPAGLLAVDPPGRAAVLSGKLRVLSDGRSVISDDSSVRYYDLAGAFHWSRAVPATVYGIAIRDHDVLVGGNWTGSFDFGRGLTTSNDSDVFVLDIVP
ncbi:hypothetical protein [Anaeromyxobacter paludicola]|uniref:Beta-propeller repeat-containing protein n=1 Tax=Anaeromyxobacter paludicola TaxID=2918171 RepID=A0ABM7XBE7_9BACT|nr:hypothetical protein [Anaeromyxobacter paludicola]BDG09180.1 hypothetical protein AMPC_22930 [Anaeromyxobacter paludicola]